MVMANRANVINSRSAVVNCRAKYPFRRCNLSIIQNSYPNFGRSKMLSTSYKEWLPLYLGRYLLHLYIPTTRFMPPFLEASAAQKRRCFISTFLSESVNLCSRSHHMECSILVSDFLTQHIRVFRHIIHLFRRRRSLL